MSRMQINALTKLVDAGEAGGYTLPAELLDAYRIYTRTRALSVPEVRPLEADAAAARVVAAVAAGDSPELVSLGAEVDRAQRDHEAHARALHILNVATEQAAGAAANLAGDLAEQIITRHLRPAFDEVHAQAREVAAALEGYGLETRRLITAPAKVRNAYASLPDLVSRKAAILEARKSANAIGYRKPQHDTTDIFATFANPFHFAPGWKSPAPVPRVPFPEDATERLLWMASAEVAGAKPWLPTVAEQDEAWQRVFGEAARRRAEGALAARAYAGQRV